MKTELERKVQFPYDIEKTDLDKFKKLFNEMNMEYKVIHHDDIDIIDALGYGYIEFDNNGNLMHFG